MVTQKQFTAGEIDVINWKRTDIESYLTGAQSLLNMVVGTTGLAQKRNGSVRMADVTSVVSPTSRIFAFKDKNQNFYIIILANLTASVYSFNGTTVTFIQTILSMPYTTADIPMVDYALDSDSLVLTHGLYPIGRIYISDYTTMPVTFAYMSITVYPVPAYDFGVVNYNVAASQMTKNADGSYQLTLTGIPTPYFTADWIGGQIVGLGTADSDFDLLGAGIITNINVVTGGSAVFTIVASSPFGENATPTPNGGTNYSIKQPAWTSALGYPKKVLFYQNRLWLANTMSLPDTIFGSKINTPGSFDTGTGLDTDAIIYNIGQSDTGGINWLNAGKQMEVYTANYELVCPQDQNSALTPSTFSVRQQSSYGSSNLFKPLTYINDSYYVNQRGNAIINFHFQGLGLAYTSSNVSLQSQHLVVNPTRAALIRGNDVSQDNFIYLCNQTSFMTTFQFAAEYKLAALTPMTFNNSPTINIMDICAVNNSLIFLKQYANGTPATTLERLGNDSVASLPLIVKMDSTQTASINSAGLVTGIGYLNGYNAHAVSPLGDLGTSLQLINGALAPAVVSGGQCFFDVPNGYTGTITVGILFETQIVPMYTYVGAQATNYYKNLSRIYVDYYQSLDFTINGHTVLYQNFKDIQAGLGLTPRTDTAVESPVNGWNRFSTFAIDQNSPYDLIVTGIEYQIDEAIV